MPLNLQDPYNQAYTKLVSTIADIRSTASKSKVFDPMSKFHARVAGSRIWLLTELQQAKKDKNNPRVAQIEKILEETDCDVRVEYRGEEPISGEQFYGAMCVYHAALPTVAPPTEFNTSFYTTEVRNEDPKFEVSFQMAHIKPRSNFDAYINEKGNYVFEGDDHKAAFERFIEEGVIETFGIQDLIDKNTGEYAADSNLASLLKSYLKPLMVGKRFSIETAAALDKFLNTNQYSFRLGKVKGHYGRLYVGKALKNANRGLYNQKVENAFNNVREAINHSLARLKESLVEECKALNIKLEGIAESIQGHDNKDELKNWGQNKDALSQKLSDESILNDFQKIAELKKAMQDSYNDATEIYNKIEAKVAARLRAESEEALKKRLAEIEAKAAENIKKDKKPAPAKKKKEKKKQKEKAVKNDGSDDDEALDRLLEEVKKEREAETAARLKNLVSEFSASSGSPENIFMNMLRHDSRLPFLSKRPDTFARCSNLKKRLEIAQSESERGTKSALNCMLMNFNATISQDFSYNNEEYSRLDAIKRTLAEWAFVIENPIGYEVPDDVRKTLVPAQSLLAFLEGQFPEGVEDHPLYIHLSTNIDLMLALAGDDNSLIDFKRFQTFNAKTAEIYASINSFEHNAVDSLVQAHLVEQQLISVVNIKKALKKIGLFDGLKTEAEFNRFRGSKPDTRITKASILMLQAIDNTFIERDPNCEWNKPRLIPSLKKNDALVDARKTIKAQTLDKYHASDLTPSELIRTVYHAFMDLGESFYGLKPDAIMVIGSQIITAFLPCAAQSEIEMVVTSVEKAEDINGALLQKFAYYYLHENPLDLEWEPENAESFYDLIVEASRFAVNTVDTLDLRAFFKWMCSQAGRQATINLYAESLNPDQVDMTPHIKALTSRISTELKVSSPAIVRACVSDILSFMGRVGDEADDPAKMPTDRLRDLVNLVFPVQGCSLNRYEQAKVYMDVLQEYLVEYSDDIPENIAQEMVTVLNLRKFLASAEKLGYEESELYKLFSDGKAVLTATADSNAVVPQKLKDTVARHRRVVASTKAAFTTTEQAGFYREIIYQLLTDNDVYEQQELIEIVQSLSTTASLQESTRVRPDAYKFDNEALQPHVKDIKDLFISMFFKKTATKTKLNQGYIKTFAKFRSEALKKMNASKLPPCMKAEVLYTVLSDCRQDKSLGANEEYFSLHELICLTFLQPCIQHAQRGQPAPGLATDVTYIEQYAKALLVGNPYQLELVSGRFSEFHKLFESQIKAAVQGAHYHIAFAANNQDTETLQRWVPWLNQFERQLLYIQSDEGDEKLKAIFTEAIQAKSGSSSTAKIVSHARPANASSSSAQSSSANNENKKSQSRR